MKTISIYRLLSLASLAQAVQPSAPAAIAAPLRNLKFGTINFLHTTDTHGWHAGHLLEPSFSADWGDYIDFTSRLREKIEAEGNDLLVVDTGDRIEGNGLYDASQPKGKYTFDIFTEQHIDIICLGNHELYKQNSSENDYNILVPAYPKAYISSNVDIFDPRYNDFVPLAPRFQKLTTKNHGIRILALGFLFDFDRNYNNTIVRKVEKVVEEQWFQLVIHDRAVDLIVIIMHSAARSDEAQIIHDAIRKVKPDIPIQFFGGHLHIRDYKKFDDKSYILASGRFLETIGFQSIDGIKGPGRHQTSDTAIQSSSPTWFRRYIDSNLYSFYKHSNTNATTFHSDHGRAVSAKIASWREALYLDKKYGCAPKDLWMTRAPFPSPNSLYSWLNESVLPEAVIEPSRNTKARIIIANTGSIRFDIFKGPFTKDSKFIMCPFTSGMHYLKDVPLDKAIKVAEILNQYTQVLLQAQDSDNETLPETWRLAPPEQWYRTSDFIPSTSSHHHDTDQIPLSSQGHPIPHLRPGYTTTDDLGTDGDDTIHLPIAFYRVPNVIQSYIPSSSAEETDQKVDLIYNEFIQVYILLALKFLGVTYTAADAGTYLYGQTMTDMITGWIEENWDMNC